MQLRTILLTLLVMYASGCMRAPDDAIAVDCDFQSIDLPDLARLSGHVSDAQGNPLGGADVSLRREDGTPGNRTQTLDVGCYQIHAAPGTWVLEASKEGYVATALRTEDLEAGGAYEYSITLRAT